MTNSKKLLHQSVILNHSDITYDDDPIEIGFPQDDNPIRLDSSSKFGDDPKNTTTSRLIRHSSTSEKDKDSDYENLQLHYIQENFPSVVKQSLNNFFNGPFFQNFNQVQSLLLSCDTPLNAETILKSQGMRTHSESCS